MHHHVAHPPGPEPAPGVLDNISDTLLNAFARVRKPDERFLSMRETVDKFEESLVSSERIWTRIRARTEGNIFQATTYSLLLNSSSSMHIGLSSDHHDLAVAIQGLGFLESGITEPLNHFSNALLEVSELFHHLVRLLPYDFLFPYHHSPLIPSSGTKVLRSLPLPHAVPPLLLAGPPCRPQAP